MAREYAEVKQAYIDSVERESWPPEAQEAIDEQLEVQRARVAWLRQIGEATTVEQLNAAFQVTLPGDQSSGVRYALDIPSNREQFSNHHCANR